MKGRNRMNVLVVVDMQNDFIDGSLGTREALVIVPYVAEKIRGFDGIVIATRDTHGPDYPESEEGKNLPVIHCVRNTEGWQLRKEVDEAIQAKENTCIIDKPTFGSTELGKYVSRLNEETGIEKITLIGVCTDICVISNALLLKAYLPEVPIEVDISCCAGVTPQSHERAAEAMKMCQISIV